MYLSSFQQAVWVFTVSLPVIFINAPSTATKAVSLFTVQDIVGLVIWVIGMFFETLGDFQKFYWRSKPDSRGKWCKFGELISWHM